MKNIFRKNNNGIDFRFDGEKLFLASSLEPKYVYKLLDTDPDGLSAEEAEEKIKEFGKNIIVNEKKARWFNVLVRAL